MNDRKAVARRLGPICDQRAQKLYNGWEACSRAKGYQEQVDLLTRMERAAYGADKREVARDLRKQIDRGVWLSVAQISRALLWIEMEFEFRKGIRKLVPTAEEAKKLAL